MSSFNTSMVATPKPPGPKQPRRRAMVCMLSLGLVMVLSTVSLLVLYDTIVHAVVRQVTAISSPSSMLFEAWLNPNAAGVPIYRKYTFFNITNPVEVALGTEVPNFVLVGPYVYLEDRVKDRDSVQWFEENQTVGYKYSTHYHFQPSMSIDTTTGEQLDAKTDIINTINMPLFGIAYRLAKLPPIVRQFGEFNFSKNLCCYVLDWAISSGYYGPTTLGPTGIFVNRSVDEILWGYVDPIWDMVHPVLKMLSYDASTVFMSEFNGTQPAPSPYTYRSGQRCPLWPNISLCNGSASGYTIEGSGTAGTKDATSAAGNISTWAGQRSLWWMGPPVDGVNAGEGPIDLDVGSKFAPSDSCTFLQGTDGLRFAPNLKRSDELRVFLDMAWRSFRFSYRKDATTKGIDAYQYRISNKELQNSTYNKKCNEIYEYGVLNISQAVFGPGIVTKAFYLDANLSDSQMNFTISLTERGTRRSLDEWLTLKYGEGGRKSPRFVEEFDPYINIHPLTGVTLEANAKGMVTTPLMPLKVQGCNKVDSNQSMFTSAANLPTTYFPIAILDRSAVLSDHWANKLKYYVALEGAGRVMLWVFMVLGFILCIVAPAQHMWRSHKALQESETADYPTLMRNGSITGTKYVVEHTPRSPKTPGKRVTLASSRGAEGISSQNFIEDNSAVQ